jgi:hypothetical protein
MVIEMLLNNDIHFFFVQIILHFQKEMNVIMSIIELKKKVNSNHFIWTKSQIRYEFKVYVFVMFKMKYLINKM